MKKLFNILAIIAIVFAMISCDGRNTTPADAESEVDTTEVVVDSTVVAEEVVE